MLSGSPWQNTANVLNVMGGTGPATPLDALAIINDLNKNGSHPLTPLASDSASSSGSVSPQGSSTQSATPLFEDVLGTGEVTPLDALKIINALGGGGDQVQVMLVATDMNGVPLASVPVGSQFQIEAFVTDISGNAVPIVGTALAQGGVFEAEIDASYNTAFASIDPNATVTFGSNYVNSQVSDLSTPGQIIGTGAFAGLNALGPGNILLWSIPVTATAVGSETFTPSAGTGSGNEIALYGNDTPIPSNEVDFVPATVNVVAATAPLLSINSVSVARPTSGTTNEIFTVTLANPSSTQTTTVNYTTQDGLPVPGATYSDGNAVAGTDYQTTSGTLTFAPNVTTQNITVKVIGSTAYNPSPTYTVDLSNAVNASIAEAQGTGTITSTNAKPTLAINSVAVARPASGTANAVFTVTLTGPTELYTAVNFSTADNTATNGVDYTATSGQLVFPAGTTSEQVTVPIIGSTAYNPNPTFKVNLKTPTNATVTTSVGVGTLTNSNPAPTLAINSPAPIQPPGSGTADDVFTVTLTGATELTTTVNYATADGTAHAGTDYNSTNGTLTFAPGVTSQNVTVAVLPDSSLQGSVNFQVNLTSPVNSTITTAQGIGTIGTPAPTLSINTPTAIVRPTSGTVNDIFTVTLANPSSTQATTVNFATANGTAIAGTDYTSTSGTLTFPANATTENITVSVIGSLAYNPSTQFTVNLSSPSTGALIGTGTGTGTINSSNPAPTVAISTPAALTRPTTGTANYVFTVTLTGPTELSATVNYATQNGTAIAGTDYTSTSGTLTFPAGITTENITVPVIGFATPVGSVNFTVNLSTPTNSSITTASATGTIVTPAGPTLAINSPAAVTKPSAGNTVDDIFTVTLANPSGTLTSTVNFATANGTAIAGLDYTSTSGTLTFAPGTTTENVTVPVIGSNAYSPTTTFSVNLSSPTNAAIVTATGTGTILSTNPAPTLAISSAAPVSRPSAGNTADAFFTVTLTGATEAPATVAFATANGTAIAGTDYTSTSGTLTFAVGTTSEIITVPVIGSNAYNPSSTFSVNLSSPTNSTITTATGTGTITSTNPAPTLAINSVAINRPASGNTANEIFTVTLTGATELPATVQYATADNTAHAGTDYTMTSGTLTFAAGTTTENITVPVIGSNAFNTSLTYNVNLSNPTNSTISTAQGTGTINNVAPAPTLSVNNPSVTRLTSGNVNEVFTVTLTGATALPATVNFATADNTAVAGVDYTMTSGTLTFAAGTTSEQVTVQVLPSTSFTGTQTYFLNLSSPTNAQPATVQGTGTILSAVSAPGFAITDPTVTKPASGTVNAVFTVTLTGATNATSTVHFATADGTAHAPGDYIATSGTLTFSPGTTSENVTVAVNGNSTFNPNETFTVNLSNPTNAAITTASATGTIVSPPVVPAVSINSVQHFVGTSPNTPTNFVFTVSLSSATTATVTVQFATADGTATVANNNYAPTSGTLTFNPGTTSENVTVPVYGYTGGATSLNFFVNLTNPSNGTLGTSQGVGTAFGNFQTSSLSGAEFIDANSNGTLDSGELAIESATIQLTGTDVLSNTINMSTTTAANGSYSFSNLNPGTYTITAVQSTYLTALKAVVGTEGGNASGTNAIQLTIGSAGGVTGTGNNFTEKGFSTAGISERVFLASKSLNGTVNLNDTSLFPPGSGTSVSSAVASPAVASTTTPAVSSAVASPAVVTAAVASPAVASPAVASSTSTASVDAAFADPQLTTSDLSVGELGFATSSNAGSTSAVDAVHSSGIWLLA